MAFLENHRPVIICLKVRRPCGQLASQHVRDDVTASTEAEDDKVFNQSFNCAADLPCRFSGI